MNEKAIVASLIEKSRRAQKVIEGYPQRKLDELAAAIVYKLSRESLAIEIAEECVKETGIGKVESKIDKLTKKIPAIFYQIKDQKTVGIIEERPEEGIIKIAKPIGVIAGLIPSTNPEATPIFKGILSLRGRNSIIFAPHPASKNTTSKVTDIMRSILKKNGAPEDLFICIDQPSKESSQALMEQADITMATGSGDMVKAAYSSGKPSYGVGAGNAVVVIDETVNLEDAAEKIRTSKTGDNASGCSAENSLIIQSAIYDDFISILKEKGGYVVNQQEKDRLQDTIWKDGHISRDIVAKPVKTIANLADINTSDNIEFLIVEETGTGKDYPFSGEKMSLVLTVYKYEKFDEAIEMVNSITQYSGLGHSCGIHSNDNNRIIKLALNTKTTRVLVRQPHGLGNSGNWFNGLANTFSLGCGTWGGNIISENVTQKHYINTTWVSEPIDRKPASEDEIFGDLLESITL